MVSAAFSAARSSSSSDAIEINVPAVPFADSIAVENAANAGPHVTSNIGDTYSSLNPLSPERTNFDAFRCAFAVRNFAGDLCSVPCRRLLSSDSVVRTM